jgi:hypothetical protein
MDVQNRTNVALIFAPSRDILNYDRAAATKLGHELRWAERTNPLAEQARK